MRRDAAKEDYLRTTGIRLLRIANGLVMQDPEKFLRKVREAIALGREGTPHPSRDGWRKRRRGPPSPQGRGRVIDKKYRNSRAGPLGPP
jgi:hypothetical protein